MTSQTVVTFGLGSVLFALPVAPVVEIIDAREAAPLPRAPACLLGLIDRRDMSVPVVDMRLLLGQPPREDSDDTRIVVLTLREAPRRQAVGLRVDRVIEVTELDADGAAPLAEAELLNWHERMVAGIGRREGAFVTLLDVEGLFAGTLDGLALPAGAPATEAPASEAVLPA
ncbi:chemotaxis protein CheW [Pseudoroseicyclus tamaricis]|uniref:Chemotaxis protein CheW n=1 Tax=Pseudoroseicyclus tamaricis TaxID=2705421 RepID=A0A6B2K1Q9_9RHOB|nr:chemotaxis protein CheW [Pseudoroseicyclus tamaricis]NDV00316.1 chemotaxis protein CheW [Pseudoroseicyclus tamaricis]